MTKRFAGLFVLALSFAGVAVAQEAENPLKKAKVGDYTVFKSSESGQIKITTKQTVSAATDKEVRIKVVTVLNGEEQPGQERKIDLTKKYDMMEAMKQGQKDMTLVETGKGEETVKAGGKEYNCTWTAYKMTTKVRDMEITNETKVWQSKDAPLYGVVKTESKKNVGGMPRTMVTELTESGSKK